MNIAILKMPSTSNAQALLELSDPALIGGKTQFPDVWANCEAWQKLTNNTVPPWRWEIIGIITSAATAVQAFVVKFWALAMGDEQNSFMKGKGVRGKGKKTRGKGKGKSKAAADVPDNDTAGRDAFCTWVKAEWPKWEMKDKVLKELREGSSDPWSHMEETNTDVVSLQSHIRELANISRSFLPWMRHRSRRTITQLLSLCSARTRLHLGKAGRSMTQFGDLSTTLPLICGTRGGRRSSGIAAQL